MRNLLYSLLAAALLPIFSTSTSAQSTVTSPYTRYGLGEMKKGNFGHMAAMGGASTAYGTNRTINPFNPASFAAMDTLSFLFDVGLTGEISQQSSPNHNEVFKNTAFDHINLAFPINRNIGVSLGVMPYSSTGFNTSFKNTSALGDVHQAYRTEGGINEFYLGGGIKLGKHLRIGANLSYLFGQIVNTSEVTVDESGYYTTLSEQKLNLKDLNFNGGIQYLMHLTPKTELTLAATYHNERKTNTSGQFMVLSVGSSFIDTIAAPDNQDLDYVIPARYSLGAAINYNESLMVLTDISMQNWEETTINSIGESFERNLSGHLGVEFVPDRTSLTSYLKLVRYRVGGFYDSGYMNLNGENIQNYGITFGLGLPIANPKTSINLSCELGKRGTSSNNLIDESYAFFGINFTFADMWFLKRKYQ
ncbi:MAG: hypothetical protein R6U66_03940 [Bacteroidales bacterium]